MIRSFKRFCGVIIESILPSISYIFIIMSLILQFGAQNSMGIYRDLSYRNTLLKNTILTFKLLHLYMLISLIGIFICIGVLYFNNKRIKKEAFLLKAHNSQNKFSRYLWCTIGISLLFIFMITIYDKIFWIAYPWMVLTVGIGVIIQYIRIIYIYKLK